MKVIALIDGLNFYHSLTKDKKAKTYKWINLRKLCDSFLTKKENLIDVYYFTTLVKWDHYKKKRHQTYIQALKTTDVKIVYGKFKKISRKCRIKECQRQYSTYEEKQTDVNIALTMLERSFLNNYNKILLLSADSDLIPAINKVKQHFPEIKTHLILPFKSRSDLVKQKINTFSRVSISHPENNLFPDRIKGKDGVIQKPKKW